jgi:hypothetical protein
MEATRPGPPPVPALPEVVRAAVCERLARGEGETWGEEHVLPLTELESGLRLGVGAQGFFAVTSAGTPLRIEGPALLRMFEVIESPRDELERQLEEGARARGLPPEETALAFPVVEIASALMAHDSSFLVRKALLFLRTSELRAAREAIVSVRDRKNIPVPLRELAAHLVVRD